MDLPHYEGMSLFDVLRELAIEDPIAAACVKTIAAGASAEVALKLAIVTYAATVANQRGLIQRYAEHAPPAPIVFHKACPRCGS